VFALSGENLTAAGFYLLVELLRNLRTKAEAEKETLTSKLQRQRNARQEVVLRLKKALEDVESQVAKMKHLNQKSGEQLSAMCDEISFESIAADLGNLSQ
jgi:hypothetical protein